MAHTKTVQFVGGPLDGKTREIASDVTSYELDQPPPPEDLHSGEMPVGFFPPFHRYVYEESPENRNVFIIRKHEHS
ncbi:hypothetical protein OCK74_10230 [Chitinophagaceae bacterium LB-8]|uniref:Uncharacterized protein n=1 Tax=Paraflavisolibacter caeni TaxID=2982496 RepID=A0A9X2XNS3_9BACT|nr:hypothetical protein [Paraflavisolibacter caeni]MCU7549493.1 hypothetical protein [Paraflavisolibacter caeni]